jgi:predicted alpha/beta hydrolase
MVGAVGPGDLGVMATVDPLVLPTANGARLGARWYTPSGRPGSAGSSPSRAVVLVGGATAVPQRFYRAWATDLADRGYDVLTLDYRGIGESRAGSLRGLPATMQDWGLDLETGLDAAWTRADGRPVLLVGHSFGGQALGLVRGGDRLSGGLTIGSQLGYYGHWPRRVRPAFGALWYGVPALVGAFGYWPGWLGMGEDLPGGVATEWARWCRSPNYLLDHVPEARARFAAVTAPFRVVAISDDYTYGPEPAVRAYAAQLPNAEVVRWTPADAGRDAIGHFGFFRPQCRALWDAAAAFLDQRVAAVTTRRSA